MVWISESRGKRARLHLALLVAGLFLVASSLTRLTLAAFEMTARLPSIGTLLGSLVAGAMGDAVAAAWLTLPVVLLLALVGMRGLRSFVARFGLFGVVWLSATLAIFVAVAEIAFFREFNGRFNFVAVDYLVYPHEVVTNVWESYPTGWILVAVLAAGSATAFAIRRDVRGAFESADPFRVRLQRTAGWLAAAVVLTLIARTLPSDVSHDRAWNEIAQNGYATFLSSLRGQDAPYRGLYRTAPSVENRSRLRSLLAEPAAVWSPAGFPARRIRPLRHPRPWNVVIVLEESLGSEFVGTLRTSGRNCTPEFDRLAEEGLLLTRAYATGNRTIRALEAVTASIPPLPGVSIVRRDRSRDLFTLPALLRAKGYRTMFVYGGRALFDGMGRYMLANGVDRVVELSDFPEESFRTAWGVSDEAIFDRALEEMESASRGGQPFFTLLLTTTNHRPFLYPDGRIPFDPREKKRENAVRYADWSLGQFFRKAHSRDFFDRTLFVVMGDHGARVYGAARIPMASYEVPILFYAPGRLHPGRLPTLASSMDVAPTILSLLGVDYESRFFGRDVLAIRPEDGRAPLTHNSNVALLEGNLLAVLGLQGTGSVWRYDPSQESLEALSPRTAEASRILRDAVAYFQGADELYRTGGFTFGSASPGVVEKQPAWQGPSELGGAP